MLAYRGFNLSQSILRLHLQPYFVCVSKEGSGESVHVCRLIRVFIAYAIGQDFS